MYPNIRFYILSHFGGFLVVRYCSTFHLPQHPILRMKAPSVRDFGEVFAGFRSAGLLGCRSDGMSFGGFRACIQRYREKEGQREVDRHRRV